MTNTLSKRLVMGLAVLVLGAAGALQANGAFAESPPNPPSRFVGTVKVNGVMAPAGTPVEARIGSASCGVSTVFMAGSEARYVIDSPALDPGASPNCGTDGATVTFLVGGQVANETGAWRNYQLNTVNLTVTTATPTAPGATATTPPAQTPGAPATGTGGPSEGGTGGWTWLIIAGFVLAPGAVAVAARGRFSQK